MYCCIMACCEYPEREEREGIWVGSGTVVPGIAAVEAAGRENVGSFLSDVDGGTDWGGVEDREGGTCSDGATFVEGNWMCDAEGKVLAGSVGVG